jgi:[ribosomal protein S5]-alanine N-acetyltransferase
VRSDNKGPVFIRGKKIYLRAVEPSDVTDAYLSWLHDEETVRFLESGIYPVTRAQLERYVLEASPSATSVHFAICLQEDDRHVGNVKLAPIHPVHRSAVFGILLGEKDVWGKGVATDAVRCAVKYAFDTLNLERVSLGVISTHDAAIRVYEKVGFRREGVERRALWRNGKWHDRLVMGILRGESGSR